MNCFNTAFDDMFEFQIFSEIFQKKEKEDIEITLF